MEYRLAALPAAWLASTAVIVEDHAGDLYLLDLASTSAELEPLDARDSMLLMQWHDLADTDEWLPLADFNSLSTAQ